MTLRMRNSSSPLRIGPNFSLAAIKPLLQYATFLSQGSFNWKLYGCEGLRRAFFPFCAAGPTGALLVGAVTEEYGFDAGDFAVLELPRFGVEHLIGPLGAGHHRIGAAIGHGHRLHRPAAPEVEHGKHDLPLHIDDGKARVVVLGDE